MEQSDSASLPGSQLPYNLRQSAPQSPSPTQPADTVADTSQALRRDLLALALLALTTIIFFWPVVSGQAWLPKGGGDSASFLYPMYRFAAESLRSGTIPFWNPHLYAGAPFLADNQSGIFYPPNLLLFLAWPNFSYRAIEFLVMWHFFFAGAAMYVCLRLLRPEARLPRTAALFGGLAFMFSDVLVTHIGNLNLIAVAAWLPLAFIGLHRAIVATNWSQRLLWALGGGLALGLGTLAGHGQMTFLLASFLVLYALYQTLASGRWLALPLLGVLGLFAIAVAAISLLPALETLQHTLRAEFDYTSSTNYSLPAQALAGLAAPGFFGRGQVAFWGDWLRVEYGYVGVLTWFLAGLALVLRPNRQTAFFALAGLLSLLLALGPQTPLYGLLAGRLPVVPFQVPARFVLLLDFCLAVLAAIGLSALLKTKDVSQRRSRGFLVASGLVTAGVTVALLLLRQSLAGINPERQTQMLSAVIVFVLLAGFSWLLLYLALRGRLSPALTGSLALLLVFVDLFALGHRVEIERNDPTAGYAAGTPGLEYLQADPGLHRIDVISDAWQPNIAQLNDLYAVRGVYNPLQMANYNVYMGSVGYRGSPQYNTMGVKYLIAGKREPPGDTSFIVPVFDEDPSVSIFLNTRALPRAMVVYNAVVATDHDAAFDATHADNYNPSETVVLEGGRALSQTPGQAELQVIRYDANEVAFRVTTDKPAYFFLSDVYHPDWRATINGVEAPILTANYAFRAVPLEPGTNEVVMTFVPAGWRAGVALSGFAVIIVVLTGLWLGKQWFAGPRVGAGNLLPSKLAEGDQTL